MSIETTVRDNLLSLAKAYRAATGASMSEVSKKFYGNASFFTGLRQGRHSISVKKLRDMTRQFKRDWPAGAEWPMLRAIFMDGK